VDGEREKGAAPDFWLTLTWHNFLSLGRQRVEREIGGEVFSRKGVFMGEDAIKGGTIWLCCILIEC